MVKEQAPETSGGKFIELDTLKELIQKNPSLAYTQKGSLLKAIDQIPKFNNLTLMREGGTLISELRSLREQNLSLQTQQSGLSAELENVRIELEEKVETENEELEKLRSQKRVYRNFIQQLAEILDDPRGIECVIEDFDVDKLADEILRKLFGMTIIDLSPTERRDLYYVTDDFEVRHQVKSDRLSGLISELRSDLIAIYKRKPDEQDLNEIS